MTKVVKTDDPGCLVKEEFVRETCEHMDNGDIHHGPVTTQKQPIYEKIVVWAEESGALSNNNAQWSFGNGDTGNIGITICEDWEIYCLTFHADSNTGNANIQMEVMNWRTGQVLVQQDMPNSAGGNNYQSVQKLSNPVSVAEGDVLGFRTDIETGTISDARVAVWLRRKVGDFVIDVSQ